MIAVQASTVQVDLDQSIAKKPQIIFGLDQSGVLQFAGVATVMPVIHGQPGASLEDGRILLYPRYLHEAIATLQTKANAGATRVLAQSLGAALDELQVLATASFASGSIYSGHGDFFNAWDPAFLARKVESCLSELERCGTLGRARPGQA